MIHAHTYIMHATYMPYIQIHTHIYTSLKGASAGLSASLSAGLSAGLICVSMCMYCMYAMSYTQIHTHTCTYMSIHTYTDTYIHIHTPDSQGLEVFLCGSGGSTRRLCTAPPTQIISDGARGVLAEREMRVECLLAEQGVHFGSPNACCARRCAKTGPGVGLRWPEKVVGHLPRGALSGARGVPPQRGVFWGRCAGIRACRGKYIQYIQIQNWIYTRYIQYIQILTYTYTYIHIHTPDNQSLEAFLCGSGGCTRRLCTAPPTQIMSDGARGVLAEREMRVECLLAEQGVHLGSPNACCARRCAKTGPGVGLRWPEKWSATCPGVL